MNADEPISVPTGEATSKPTPIRPLGVHAGGSSFTCRTFDNSPEPVPSIVCDKKTWKPKPDLTVLELAAFTQLMTVMLASVQSFGRSYDIPKYIAKHNLTRHFE